MSKFTSNVFDQKYNSHPTKFGVTVGVATTLLSGIGFIDSWQGTPQNPFPLHRLYLNPNAAHPLVPEDIAMLQAAFGAEMNISQVNP